MLFNSAAFLVFFPLVTLLYFLVPSKFRWIHLLIASSIFYAAFIPTYLLILLVLILIDYYAGILIEKSIQKKRWLILSIAANIGLLGIFKYYNFFISNVNSISSSNFLLLHLALPIGLSFHTFQSLSYTIEVYRGRQKAVRHLGYYALYVMFYPQLVAGPIERPYHLFPQLFARHRFSAQHLYEGLRLMAWGFFKKTVVADRLGGYVNAVYSSPDTMNAGNIWTAIIFFTIQIYADFSGYSDIALGAARCMGFELMINFDRPHEAPNIRDFWRRWHISLSSWFRDYVYIPLGGNKKGNARRNFNTLVTFTLCGLWHGAGWTFIVWGFLHGCYIVFYNSFSNRFKSFRLPYLPATGLTFLCVALGLVFFRASSLQNAFDVFRQSINPENFSWKAITTMRTAGFQYGNFSILITVLCIGFMFATERVTNPLLTNLTKFRMADICIFLCVLLLILFFGVFHQTSFIYFQF